MALADLQGRIQEVNDAYLTITGYSRNELTGMNFQSLTHPVGLAVVKKVAERLSGDVGVKSELGNGSCLWVAPF